MFVLITWMLIRMLWKTITRRYHAISIHVEWMDQPVFVELAENMTWMKDVMVRRPHLKGVADIRAEEGPFLLKENK